MTMDPYLMGGSSTSSNKQLMIFTGTDPEDSDYLTICQAFTTKLISIIGPGPVNTPLTQNWIHSCTALIQITLDDAAQKWFSILPIDIKSDRKRLTQEYSKLLHSDMFDSVRHQRVHCNEIHRLPNKTIKQLAIKP